MNTITESREVPVIGKYDVVVCGGGVAGIAAALAARRAGKSVLLIEKSLELGGLATLGQINLFVPMCNGRGIQIVKGMCDEMIRWSTEYGYDVTPEEWKDGEPKEPTRVRYTVRYSACMFALTLTEKLHDEGIDMTFDTIASYPVMEQGHCKGIIVENKSGRSYYEAGIVVDTTGDADIMDRAGMPTVKGINYFTYLAYSLNLKSCQEAVETGRIEKAIYSSAGGRASLWGKNHPKDLPFYNSTSGEEVNRYIIDNQIEMLNNLKKDDRRTRQVINLPGMPQTRTSRRLEGDYVLQQNDAYRHFEDSISVVNDFEHPDFLWEVPYRTLVKTGFDNIITAGRCASGTDYAWDVLRVIPAAIVTGQAAGLAAVQALDTGKAIYDVDVPALQKELEAQNVMIHFDDAWVPTGDDYVDVMKYTKLDEKGNLPWMEKSHDEV